MSAQTSMRPRIEDIQHVAIGHASGLAQGTITARDIKELCAYALRLEGNHQSLLDALKGVVRVADRKTVEFDAAHEAIARAEGEL